MRVSFLYQGDRVTNKNLKGKLEGASPLQNLYLHSSYPEVVRRGVLEGRSPSTQIIFPFPLIRGRG